MAIKEVAGNGLIASMYYGLFGWAIFPIFYGMIAYLIYRYGKMLINADHYIEFDGSFVRVGERAFPVGELMPVTSRKNAIWVREIVFKQGNYPEFAIPSYFLREPYASVVGSLNELIVAGRCS